jgi:hypothetical protein
MGYQFKWEDYKKRRSWLLSWTYPLFYGLLKAC